MIRLAVRCSPEQAEEVLAELLVLAPNGVEEESGPGWVEYAIYGGSGEVPELGDVRAAVGDGLVELSSSEVPDDWADRWADFHQPIVIAGRLRVRPSWEQPVEGLIDVMIDPGQAFGTGAHATTRLCLELMLELESVGRAGGPLADWGTGSAVLAIAAAKLGWGPIVGCDREAPALEAAVENAAANGVEIEVIEADVRTDPLPIAPTVLANITSPLLLACAASLAGVAPAGPGSPLAAGSPAAELPQLLVCSGMLEREVAEVRAAFEALGLTAAEIRSDGDWSAMLLE